MIVPRTQPERAVVVVVVVLVVVVTVAVADGEHPATATTTATSTARTFRGYRAIRDGTSRLGAGAGIFSHLAPRHCPDVRKIRTEGRTGRNEGAEGSSDIVSCHPGMSQAAASADDLKASRNQTVAVRERISGR
jgi:hypothetical protein